MSESEWTVWEHQSFLWSCVVESCKVISQSLELWKDEVQWISLFSPTAVGFKFKFGSNGSLNLERMWFSIYSEVIKILLYSGYISVLGYSTVYLVWGALICWGGWWD